MNLYECFVSAGGLGSRFRSILRVGVRACVLRILPVQRMFAAYFCIFILFFKKFLLPSLLSRFLPLLPSFPSPASFAVP